MSTEIIYFYSTKGPWGFLSNFYRCDILLDGKVWPTSEHYYQAQKFEEDEVKEMVRNKETPSKSASLGRLKIMPLREGWDEMKDGVMKKVLLAKFTQHKNLRDKLLATGNAILMENSPRDSYWGIGCDGAGLNKLGYLIMEVRAELN